MLTHQVAAFEWLKDRKRSNLILPMGAGKTRILLEIVRTIYKGKKVAVATTKNIAYNTWVNEIEKFSLGHEIEILTTEAKVYKETVTPNKAFLFSMSIAQLQKYELVLNDFDAIIIDESTLVKNTKSIRFKTLKRIISSNPSMSLILATGTAITNNIEDAYAYIDLLYSVNPFGNTINQFRNQNGYPVQFKGHVVYKWGYPVHIRKALLDLLAAVSFTMEPAFRTLVKTEWSEFAYADIAKIHSSIKRKSMIEHPEYNVYFENNPSKLIAARTMTSGFVYHTPINGVTKAIVYNNYKANHLKGLLSSSRLKRERTVIFYNYVYELTQLIELHDELERPYIVAAQSKSIQSDWEDTSKLSILIQISAGSHGLNLQTECSHVIMYSMQYAYDIYEQAIARVARYPNKTVYVILLAPAESKLEKAMLSVIKRRAKVNDDFILSLL